MGFDDVFNQAVETWRNNGARAAATYVATTLDGTSGEDRGRLLRLLGDLKTESGDMVGASACYVDALELISSPGLRFEVMACAMDLCVQTRRFKQGMKYAVEADNIRHTTSISDSWLGVYHLNSGRLAMLATDYNASVEDIAAAVHHFRASSEEEKALNAEYYLADVLMRCSKLEEALTLCRKVRVNAKSDIVRFNVTILQGMIAAKLGDFPNANRLAAQAIEKICGKLGKQMSSGLVSVMTLVKTLVEQGNSVQATDILRLFIERFSALGGVDASEILRGVDE